MSLPVKKIKYHRAPKTVTLVPEQTAIDYFKPKDRKRKIKIHRSLHCSKLALRSEEMLLLKLSSSVLNELWTFESVFKSLDTHKPVKRKATLFIFLPFRFKSVGKFIMKQCYALFRMHAAISDLLFACIVYTSVSVIFYTPYNLKNTHSLLRIHHKKPKLQATGNCINKHAWLQRSRSLGGDSRRLTILFLLRSNWS